MDTAHFWKWFASIANELANNVEARDLLSNLDAQVAALDSRFSWEIGPGQAAEWCLAISPNLDKAVFPATKEVVSQAPVIPRWEILPSRQKKDWDGRFDLETESGKFLALNAATWRYVLLRYSDGEHEILVEAADAKKLSSDDRWTAAAIALEGLLGERTMLEKVESFELVPKLEPRFALQKKPLMDLPRAFSTG